MSHAFSLWNAPEWFSKKLSSEFPEIEVIHRNSYDGIENDLEDAEILLAFSLRALNNSSMPGNCTA